MVRQDSDAGLFAHPWVRCISQLGKVLELAGSADPAGRHGARFALLSSHSWSQVKTERTLPKPGGWGMGHRHWETNEGGKVGGAGLEASLRG